MIEITPIEPNRLKLIWQSNGPDRNKYLVGELVRSSNDVSLSYFCYSSDFISAVRSGFEGHPAFPLMRPVHHSNVLNVFSRRLPSRQRNDFFQYLQKYRLSALSFISDFALLGYTGAYLPSDGFSFAIDWRFQELPAIFMMEVSGFRYNEGMTIDMSELSEKYVQLIREPDNEFDENAIALHYEGKRIGYVPRYYANDLLELNDRCQIFCRIERIDGAMLRPQVYLLTTLQFKQLGNALMHSGI